MSTIFDPIQFASMTFTDANDTEFVVVPIGDWSATIKKAEIARWESKDRSKSGLKLSVQWTITDSAVIAETGRNEPMVRQEIMLDLTENGGLDKGRGQNVNLGRLRAAVGLNTPGQDFAFPMLVGRQARIQVSHRPDDRNPGSVFAEVRAVGAL